MRKSSKVIALCSIAFALPMAAADYGFPTLNTIGRYFGTGWSHHSYHSTVNGRFTIIEHRHPGSDYPSQGLSYPYSPHHLNYPASGAVGNPMFYDWTPPAMRHNDTETQNPTLAPEPTAQTQKKAAEKPSLNNSLDAPPLRPAAPAAPAAKNSPESPARVSPVQKKADNQLFKPSIPQPDLLRPFLDPPLQGTPVDAEEDQSEIIELQPSPSDNPKPKSAILQPITINRYKLR